MILNPPPIDWECEHCTVTDRTPWDTANRFHDCQGLAGLTAPLVRAGSRSRLVVTEREDYVGTEDVQYDGNGRPVSVVTVERPDGSNDTVVYAPTAHGGGQGFGG